MTPVWAQVAPERPVERPRLSELADAARRIQPAGPTLPGFGQIFKEAGKDLTRLPSVENLTLFGLGASAAIIGHAWDAPVSARMAGSPGLEEALEAGEGVGGGLAQFGAAMATYTIGRASKSPTVTALGADLVRAQIVAQALTQTIKLTTRRTRPDGTSQSFPSGHVSTSFATATVLQRHFGWKAGVPAYALATYVAANRIQTRRHYLSDVIFGATVGLIAGRTVTVGRGDYRFALAPLATPGGVGVSLVHIGR